MLIFPFMFSYFNTDNLTNSKDVVIKLMVCVVDVITLFISIIIKLVILILTRINIECKKSLNVAVLILESVFL